MVVFFYLPRMEYTYLNLYVLQGDRLIEKIITTGINSWAQLFKAMLA